MPPAKGGTARKTNLETGGKRNDYRIDYLLGHTGRKPRHGRESEQRHLHAAPLTISGPTERAKFERVTYRLWPRPRSPRHKGEARARLLFSPATRQSRHHGHPSSPQTASRLFPNTILLPYPRPPSISPGGCNSAMPIKELMPPRPSSIATGRDIKDSSSEQERTSREQRMDCPRAGKARRAAQTKSGHCRTLPAMPTKNLTAGCHARKLTL